LTFYHNGGRGFADGIGQVINGNQAFLIPGTDAFDSAFNSMTKRNFFWGRIKIF